MTPWTVPTSLLCPWDFPGKNTGVGCHFLLQGIFPTQGLNLGLIPSWLQVKRLTPLPGDPCFPSSNSILSPANSKTALHITPWTPGHSLDFRLLQDQWVPPTPALVVLIYNPGRDRKTNHCLINCICPYRGKRGPEEKQKETEEGKLILVFSPSHTSHSFMSAMLETQVRSLGQKIPWRRAWQPTPVFLPGESLGQRSLAGARTAKSGTQLK